MFEMPPKQNTSSRQWRHLLFLWKLRMCRAYFDNNEFVDRLGFIRIFLRLYPRLITTVVNEFTQYLLPRRAWVKSEIILNIHWWHYTNPIRTG